MTDVRDKLLAVYPLKTNNVLTAADIPSICHHRSKYTQSVMIMDLSQLG